MPIYLPAQDLVSVRGRGAWSIPSYVKEWEKERSVQWWKSRIDPSTFPPYWTFVYRFFQFLHKGPDEAKQWAKDTPDKYDVLNEIQAFINTLDGLRWKSKLNAYTAILSFFVHNRVPLPADPSFQIRSNVPRTERQITIPHLRELIGLATQPYRSMILVKWMSLQDSAGIDYINRNHAHLVVNALREDQTICRLDMPGRKKSKNRRTYFTFIGKDALDSLQEYFDRMRGWPKEGEPIWIYGHSKYHPDTANNVVTKIAFIHSWIRLLRRAGLINKKPGKRTSRYGFNAHNTRDLAISKLEEVKDLKPSCSQFWAGHNIDPNGYKDFYTNPSWVQEQYTLAQPYLNIISNQMIIVTKTDPELLARVESQEAQHEALRKMVESLQKQLEGKQL